MSKKAIALSTMLVSVLLILISVEKVTMRGVAVSETTLNQTFLLSGHAYNNLFDSGKSIFVFSTILFTVGSLLPFVPNFLLFEQYKCRSIILMVINTIGVILGFLSYNLYSYLFMMAMVCIIVASNILIQFLLTLRSKIDFFILILSVFILIINCYYLFEHFMRQRSWLSWNDMMLKDMIQISRTNIICFALWFIPYVILLVKEIWIEKSNAEKL